MPAIGVRKLKTRASEILREVRDRRVRYVITYGGRPIGVLLPLSEAPEAAETEPDPWEELARLGQQIE